MEREQHIVQDAAEHYAVYVMQAEAVRLGVGSTTTRDSLHAEFRSHLAQGGIAEADFDTGKHRKYKDNADKQLPAFVGRLSAHFPGRDFAFENVERDYRNRGLKADFLIRVEGAMEPIAVSLKNYVGTGGIKRPQVMSGTFASFAASFVFERAGVGIYLDPRTPGRTFKGSAVAERNAILRHMDLEQVVEPLEVLDALQLAVRTEFLGADCEFYDQERVKAAVARIADPAIEATLEVFDCVGIDRARQTILSRVGLDGKEEALFFDADRYVDSITNTRYHELHEAVQDRRTRFAPIHHKQSIRFLLERDGDVVLTIDVPYTINTNGAWHRPTPRYEGFQTYNDKGKQVALLWGQRRPRKSKEIATSVNTYVNLGATGIFTE